MFENFVNFFLDLIGSAYSSLDYLQQYAILAPIAIVLREIFHFCYVYFVPIAFISVMLFCVLVVILKDKIFKVIGLDKIDTEKLTNKVILCNCIYPHKFIFV